MMMILVFKFLKKRFFYFFSYFLKSIFRFRNLNYILWILFFDILYNIYPLSFASLIGFHDKVFLRQIGEIKSIELFTVRDDSVGLCKRYSSFYKKILGLKLIICQTDTLFVIEFFDVEKVPSIIPQDSKIKHGRASRIKTPKL